MRTDNRAHLLIARLHSRLPLNVLNRVLRAHIAGHLIYFLGLAGWLGELLPFFLLLEVQLLELVEVEVDLVN